MSNGEGELPRFYANSGFANKYSRENRSVIKYGGEVESTKSNTTDDFVRGGKYAGGKFQTKANNHNIGREEERDSVFRSRGGDLEKSEKTAPSSHHTLLSPLTSLSL